jgi:hypothetical protein
MIGRLLKWSGAGVLVLLVAAGAFAAHEWYADKPFFVNNFYNRAFIQYTLKSPEQLTQMGVLESIGIRGHNARWDDASLAAEEEFFRLSRRRDGQHGAVLRRGTQRQRAVVQEDRAGVAR